MVPTTRLGNELRALGFRNLEVVARGVDTRLYCPSRRSDALRRTWGAAPNDVVALTVGRLAPEKNLDVVLAAYASMTKCKGSCRLVLVGDGPIRSGLQARYPQVIFAGTRHGEDLATHYASADVFLFPSLSETFGNVTLEAMASGLAVIAFDYAAAAEHIVHGRSGLLAAFDDTAGFVQLALELAGQPARIREIGLQARQTAETLGWEQMVLRMESLLLSLVGFRAGQLTNRDASATASA